MTSLTKKEMVEKDTVIGTKCDGCGKTTNQPWPSKWVRVEGNLYKDACSPECVMKLIAVELQKHITRGGGPYIRIGRMDGDFARRFVALTTKEEKNARDQ